MAYETIKLNIEGAQATVTINRPPMNPLNSVLFGEMVQALEEVEKNSEVKVIIVNSEGDKAFAAGADVKEMVNLNAVEVLDFCQGFKKVCLKLEDMTIPSIAVVKGLALGGGCELAMACDFRIAADNAQFAQPEINLGVIPGAGGTQRLSRLIGAARAKELVMTGDMIDAATAEKYGLVNKVASLDEVDGVVAKFAKKLASKPKVAIRMAKAAIDNGQNMDLISALNFEIESFAITFATEDRLEGMKALLEKRKPEFKDK